MKKLLGIVVLGLLFSNPTFANTFKVLDIVYKDNNKIYIVKNRWGTTDRKVNIIAYNHCTSLGKKTLWTMEYRNRYKSPCNPEFKRVGKRLAFKVLNTGKNSGQQGKCD